MLNVQAGFKLFPEAGLHIGRILAGYGELEFELFTCLGVAIDDDTAAFRVMFRSRGEEGRLMIADALMRKRFADAGLQDHYDTMLGAYRWQSVRTLPLDVQQAARHLFHRTAGRSRYIRPYYARDHVLSR